MVDKVEIKSEPTGSEAPEVTKETTAEENKAVVSPSRPEWLPEKFESPEALAQAYSELEKQFTKENQTAETKDAVSEIVENAGLNMDVLTDEYSQQGQLSDDSYEKLSKAGIDRQYVDGYIRGQEALALQYQSEVVSITGGRDKYSEMITWASQNLAPEEVLAFNTSVNSGDIAQAKLAVKGLFSQFSETEGLEPSLVRGGVSGESGSVFRSLAELTEAMSNPKYKNDPAYRQDVINKLARSNIM